MTLPDSHFGNRLLLTNQWGRKDSVFRHVHYLAVLLLATTGIATGEVSPALLELNKASFFYGREYFILRSGRAQMLLQASLAFLRPAFTWMLFDAQNAKQSARKESTFNFVPNEGFCSSALEVVLGGFPFTALGHRTDTRWVVAEGVPTVEAVGGLGGFGSPSTSALLRRKACSAARCGLKGRTWPARKRSRCACACRRRD